MTDLAFTYYPGCSQTGSAKEYGDSSEAVCLALGIELTELPDWNCCGASSAHMTNDLLSVALPARNLAIARRVGQDILVVCAACYSRMRIAQKRILEDSDLARRVESIVGANPRFNGRVRHLLDVLVNDIGIPTVKERVTVRLEGLKIVPYYGCLLVRPPEVCFSDSVESPTELDRFLEALGAEIRPWAFKTDCCGGSLALSRTDVTEKLVNKIFVRAEEAGANCIAAACPMCVANLEMRQKPAAFSFELPHRLPVLYFTELLAIAMGLPGVDGWLKSHIIDPFPLVKQANLLKA